MLHDVISMSSIQDIRALEQRITDIVDDYIQQLYNEKIKVGKTTELYPLKDLVCVGDDGKPEADCDRISDIANSWIFLD